MTETIEKYFPSLSPAQLEQLSALPGLYEQWNSKINVISRRDIGNVMLHHVLHSLAIAKIAPLTPGTKVLDVGTGGGFPGIPLAIVFPEAEFRLIDSIGKKILVAGEVCKAVGLKNVELAHINLKEERGKYDFIVSRAVMNASELLKMSHRNVSATNRNALHNGIIALKGGDLVQELEDCERIRRTFKGASNAGQISKWEISNFFEENYFYEKYVVHIPF